MKNSKLLNSLIFQLLLTIVFSTQLIATEPVDIWKDNSQINIESTKSKQIKPDDKKKSLFEEIKVVKTNIFQENNEDLDFSKVYGLFDPEENDLSLEIWIESDGKVLLEHLKRIEKINLSKDSEELLIKIFIFIIVSMIIIFLISKLDLPAPNKIIKQKIPNEKFKVIK